MRAWTMVALLVALAFAGCFGDDQPTSAGSGSDDPRSLEELEMQADSLEIESDPDKGIIRGLVVDAAIRPMAGAIVTVRALSGEAEPLEGVTGENGLFGFGNLEPGSYSVVVKRLGYFDTQTSIDVEAGVKNPPVLKIIMEADPAATPFVELMKYDGFIECSVVAIALRFALCSGPAIVTDIACDFGGVCLGNLTNDQFLARHEIDPNNVDFLQSEMTWDSTQPLGTRMNAVPGYWNPETGDWEDVESIDGESPIVMRFNETQAVPMAENSGFQVRVFSSYPEETEVVCDPLGVIGCLWGVGLTLQQEFTIITHAFHGFTPEEGWTFQEQGAPVVPR